MCYCTSKLGFYKEGIEWYSSVVYDTLDSDNPTPADLWKASVAIKGLQTLNSQQRNHLGLQEL